MLRVLTFNHKHREGGMVSPVGPRFSNLQGSCGGGVPAGSRMGGGFSQDHEWEVGAVKWEKLVEV